MAKHKIAVLPGDGVGRDVIEAAMLVLDKLAVDAEYIYGDIGWEFWCKEGNALPDRTIKMLKETDGCLFGAITSKPKEDAAAELDPAAPGQGPLLFQPDRPAPPGIRPLHEPPALQSLPGKSAQLPGQHRPGDLPGEHRGHVRRGGIFSPARRRPRRAAHPSQDEAFKDSPLDEIALSTRIMTKKGCGRIVRAAFEFARKNKRRSVTIVEKPNVLRETGGLMLAWPARSPRTTPEIPLKEANIDAMCMWLVKNPHDYDVLVAENLFGDIISDLAAQLVGGLGFACGRKYRRQVRRLRADPRLGPQVRGPVQGQSDRHVPGGPD